MDLVRRFKGQYPVPTYAAEFLLGRYCASIDDEEINEGLQVVERQLSQRTVRAGEQELFKARAKDRGAIKIIDLSKAKLNDREDCFEAELPSLQLKDVRITPELVRENERMLTGGCYAETSLSCDAAMAQERGGRPFGMDALRPFSYRNVMPRIRSSTEGGDSVRQTGRSFLSVALAWNPNP